MKIELMSMCSSSFHDDGFLLNKIGLINKLNECISAINELTELKEASNTKYTGCKCVVKATEVPSMCIIYPRRDCQYHGHLHGSNQSENMGV